MKTIGSLDGQRLYLDSNVFIYAFEGAPGALRSACSELLRAAARRRVQVTTSLLTRAEVLVLPLRLQQIEMADRYRRLLEPGGVMSIGSLNADIVERAARLRADYRSLRLPDALHVATALAAACDVFITGDRKLIRVDGAIRVVTLDQLH